ncbi:hypothetical protein [Vibrio gallaecicus]|uniref:hypothetical protein n=1 Tax=Vibrio gallaecicus TaxID=552386 RepID=UPI0025B5EC2E|nr:hypothetical protein [Vibrio gallaecicus]MDN3616773.1 hypothetical protein [Vibrio gallaecicus]
MERAAGIEPAIISLEGLHPLEYKYKNKITKPLKSCIYIDLIIYIQHRLMPCY